MTLVTLTDAWQRLSSVQFLQFSAKSKSPSGDWNGSGKGTVTVTIIDNSTITFTERGRWVPDSGVELDFNNVYRWTLAEDAGVIQLEHLRSGPNQPVFLLDLAPTRNTTFESVSPHCCGADLYTAIMEFKNDAVYLSWRVKDPDKDEEICCIYT